MSCKDVRIRKLSILTNFIKAFLKFKNKYVVKKSIVTHVELTNKFLLLKLSNQLFQTRFMN